MLLPLYDILSLVAVILAIVIMIMIIVRMKNLEMIRNLLVMDAMDNGDEEAGNPINNYMGDDEENDSYKYKMGNNVSRGCGGCGTFIQ